MIDKTISKITIQADDGEREIVWSLPIKANFEDPEFEAYVGSLIGDVMAWAPGYVLTVQKAPDPILVGIAAVTDSTRFDLAIKWGPAWTDQATDDPDNYDHYTRESLTLSEAFDVIEAFPAPIIEITLEPDNEVSPPPLKGGGL